LPVTVIHFDPALFSMAVSIGLVLRLYNRTNLGHSLALARQPAPHYHRKEEIYEKVAVSARRRSIGHGRRYTSAGSLR
jgi:hypothetical protein